MMTSIHSKIAKRHKRIIQQHVKESKNQQRESTSNTSNYEKNSTPTTTTSTIHITELPLRLAQKNVELVMYLNYLRFLNSLIRKSNELSNNDSSSEVLPKHLMDTKIEMLKRFRG